MSNQPVPVILDKGLDTLTHPVVAEPGTLIDCLNYEMTTDSGYRRIDGFEAYDGWLGGDIADYYYLPVTITDAAIEAGLTPGTTLSSVNTVPLAPELALGVIVDYDIVNKIVVYVPANREAPIIPAGTPLDINLNSASRMVAAANSYKASTTDSASTFVANLRAYSEILRSATLPMTTPVAGMHWFRHHLVVARDCYVMTYTDTDSTSRSMVQVGSIIGYLTEVYRVITRSVSGTTMTLNLERLANQVNNSSVRVLSEASNVLYTTLASPGTIQVITTGSDQAYLVALNTPQTSTDRGRVTLRRSVHLKFSGGVPLAESNFIAGSLITIGTGADTTAAIVKNVELLSGTYAASTAAGWIEVVIDRGLSGNNDYIQTTDDITIAGITKLADIDQIVWSTIPGSNKLHETGTRYQWITANFYGQSDTTEMYGATGASKGFWAQAYHAPITSSPPPGVTAVETLEYSWGNIWTDRVVTARDIPKYVAFHGGSLAFAIASSVVRSIAGVPYTFNGALGATETATGDDITGLLEATNDTLIIFGRRSIRRLTGYGTADLNLRTISTTAGAFDYTAVMLGSQPVFTGPAGISTLDQAEAYGDFAGVRVSDPVANSLVPKLITDWTDSEPGGVAMALPVRSKNQYRLWISTGEVYTVTFTNKGPKIMKSNYGLGSDVRVPLAWTSELADTGKERTMVRWNDVLAANNVNVDGTSGTLPSEHIIYELDRGWGFNGRTFKHYFDITHAFGESQAIQIVGARLHGWGYGLSTLDLKSAGVEDSYDQEYHTAIQDISMPRTLTEFSLTMRPVTAIVDQANWGLGVKLRINGTYAENLTTTEPSHICQVLVMQVNPTGAKDN